MARTQSLFSKPSLLRTMVIILSAIAMLFSADVFLARMEHAESRMEGQRFYSLGQQLLQQGAAERAAQQFTAALAVVRDNPEYELALAEALTLAGRYSDAESKLEDLLQKDATGGPANLAMARVLVKDGRTQDGYSYFHRAIYGKWPKNTLANRVQVRFELVNLLVAQNAKEELLAELLPLQEEAPDDSETKMKLGRWFVAAGSPVRGAELFRGVLRKQPETPDAFAGLGEAEFARGNYRSAMAQFQTALRFRPDDAQARRQIAVCDQILALDPTQRGLNPEEQFRRSLKLLELVVTEALACLDPATRETEHELFDNVARALKRRSSGRGFSSPYEANLELAEALWQLRKAKCTASTTNGTEYLSLLLNHLVQ